MKNSERGVLASRRGSSSHAAEYEPLTSPDTPTEMQPGGILDDDELDVLDTDSAADDPRAPPFSWIDYGVFGFLGMAMLWAWNMFLAAAPYFESRFQGSPWIETNFQPTIMTVSTGTSLVVVVALTKQQRAASYPFRIACGLLINAATFALLTASTTVALDASPRAYFAFVLAMVAATSVATGLLQNGALAFAAGFGRPEYMQALVTGQSVAGVLPALSELVSVLMFPARRERRAVTATPESPAEGKTSAFVYFLAAVAISVVAMVAMIPLVRHHKRNTEYRVLDQADNDEDVAAAAAYNEEAEPARKVVSMSVLFAKLRWLASGIALVFTTTMFFPVFTAKIRSVNEPTSDSAAPGSTSPIFAPDAFVPLAFFFWNLGDFGGRLSTALSAGRGLGANTGRQGGRRPRLLFKLAALRVVQLPLYLLCNLGGRGAAVPSDLFYLLLVQAPFGFTNGWLCSRLMTSAGSWVEEGERAAAGGFMGLCLMTGLAVGSVLSFSVAGI